MVDFQRNAQKCKMLLEKLFFHLANLIYVCIYALSNLGDLSHLIGSLSRTIQQYSPSSEWIMCDLGVFSHFFRE